MFDFNTNAWIQYTDSDSVYVCLKGSYNAIFIQVNLILYGLNEKFVIYFN